MADDPNQPPRGDNFGWGQQPLHRTDETTGDEGIEPPVGQGHDEATLGRSSESPESPGDQDQDQDDDEHADRRGEPHVPGYPTQARGADSQE